MFKKVKIEYPDCGMSATTSRIGGMIGLAESTVYRIIKEYKQTGELTMPKKHPGRKSLTQRLMDDLHEPFIIFLGNDSDTSVSDNRESE